MIKQRNYILLVLAILLCVMMVACADAESTEADPTAQSTDVMTETETPVLPATTESMPTEQSVTESAETTPAETEPTETESAETAPKETEPAETEPTETEPAETEPTGTEPTETEPAEIEPEETQAPSEGNSFEGSGTGSGEGL